MDIELTYSAFAGWQRIANGTLPEMLRETKARVETGLGNDTLLIFEDQTGKQVDFDFRGSIDDVLERALPKPIRTGPGRPKLGVVSREVSLLPRHWDWLETQPQGASATLRRLIEDARKRDSTADTERRNVEAKGRFMSAMSGNLPNFEEAYRALYARNPERLRECVKDWPQDVRNWVVS